MPTCTLCKTYAALDGDELCRDCAADRDQVPIRPGLFHKPQRFGFDWSHTVCGLPLQGPDRVVFDPLGRRDKHGQRIRRTEATYLLPDGDDAGLHYHNRHGHAPCPICHPEAAAKPATETL